ncbi:hypothetical protein HPNQ4161_0308 [Helicobacter pylori NQ4161]|nr:hypothetical protein HPNQ4161_0308 [Helicobacter pylori NQ4161]
MLSHSFCIFSNMPLLSIQIAFIITKGLKTNFKPDKIPFFK